MIISRIIGGLGNQMFQYAAGRALALRHGVPLKLDTAGFAGYGLHNGFELERLFQLGADCAESADIRQVLGWQASSLARRVLAKSKLKAMRSEAFVVEPHFEYWPGVLEAPTSCYLYGYWQSERYFADEALTIREDFTFRPPLEGKNAELSQTMATGNAVSLHVRRGDYVQNATNASMYHECLPDYYQRAVSYVEEREKDLILFIFSDDIVWCRRELKFSVPCHFIDHNQAADSFYDMYLMSLCKHNIIANSSFSWWGAWLNAHQDKIVIAPQNWFRDERSDRDLCPSEWVRL